MSSITEDAGVVYLLTNKVNGKQYVGQSWNYEKRMAEYRRGACKRQSAIHAAIAKHGWNNFTAVKIVQGIETQEWLDKIETGYIKAFNTLSPHGYNLKSGGAHGKFSAESRKKIGEAQRGRKASQETRKKMSDAQRGERNHNFGKSHSLETRKKIGAKSRGRTPSQETRNKISEAKRGKTHSSETRNKMSVSAKARHARERKSTATISLL